MKRNEKERTEESSRKISPLVEKALALRQACSTNMLIKQNLASGRSTAENCCKFLLLNRRACSIVKIHELPDQVQLISHSPRKVPKKGIYNYLKTFANGCQNILRLWQMGQNRSKSDPLRTWVENIQYQRAT